MISSPGGWYDAGDYNKYIVNSAYSIGLMQAIYARFPDYFIRQRVNIPESGNHTPDLLDEMYYNLKWMLTMQDPADGGVYHKLTTPSFEGFIKPTECKQPRYVVQKSVTAALDYAAALAQASVLFAPYEEDYPGFSEVALQAAERAYAWQKRIRKRSIIRTSSTSNINLPWLRELTVIVVPMTNSSGRLPSSILLRESRLPGTSEEASADCI